MPNIKQKSNEYMIAAQELINKSMFNSSIHCSYYSRLLQMKYILAHYSAKPICYAVQDKIDSSGSHEYILNEIRNRVRDSKKAKEIVDIFRLLKNRRVKADYRDVLFSLDDSLDIKQKSESLERKLKDQFGAI